LIATGYTRTGITLLRSDRKAGRGYVPIHVSCTGESNVHNLEAPLKAFYRIVTWGRAPLVRHKSGVSKIGDGFGDKPEVEFLCVIDFQAARHPRYMYVTDVIDVFAQSQRDVAIHDLSVVDVIQDFHAR
jgi:hypothetical protein